MTTLTQANRDTYFLDTKLHILTQPEFEVWSCAMITPNTMLYRDKRTSPPAKGQIRTCYNRSTFQTLLEIWNFAGKNLTILHGDNYHIIITLTRLSVVLEVPKQ